MSIDFCDNFTVYGGNTAFLTNGMYASAVEQATVVFALSVDPDGLSGGRVLHWQSPTDNGVNVFCRCVLDTPHEKVGMALRQWLSQLPFSGVRPAPMSWRDASNNRLAFVSVSTTGQLMFTNVGSGVTYTTVGPVISANGWWHIEAMIDVSDGSFDVRVEGLSVLSGTGENFGANPVAQTAFEQIGGGGGWDVFIKDFVRWNGDGAHNNDFLGTVIVALLNPTADVALNWTPTPGGSAGAMILSNIPPQDGVQYIDAPNPPPAAYVASMSDLSPDVTSVKAVMTMVRAQKLDGGDASLQTGIISSPLAAPATVLGANRPITVAPTYWHDIFETDPKTGAPWLPSAVNAANMQINRTT